MNKILQLNILLFSVSFILCSLPALSSDETPTETYDNVLARLEKIKEIRTKEENKKRIKEQNKKDNSDENKEKENNKEELEITADNYVLTFDHDKLPNLNGIWILKKKTIKRKVNPVLTKPITFRHCNTRLPFEKRDFEEKQVVIAESGPDSFTAMAIYPITDDIYHDPNIKKDIIYQNFSFKASIRPEDITYAYTIKLKDPIENSTLARQLWLNGKLKLEHISGSSIKAKGWEVEYTPECQGFIVDEIAFEFEKERNIKGAGEGIVPHSFLIEQAANAATGEGSEPNEIPDENKPMNLESAKEKIPLETIKKYKGENNLVPGLW